jgi:hypothetical protein
MPMRSAFFALMPLLTGTTVACAGTPIPTFDVAAKCERQLMVPGCVEVEHAAVTALHFWWNKVRDEEMKALCVAQASAAPSLNYSHLMGCIGFRARLPGHSLAEGADPAGRTIASGTARLL